MADTKKLQSPDALKARFKAGSIPLQSDFADLIDLANAGAVAAGQAASQDNNAGLGMIYDSTGKLALNVYRTYDFNSSNDLSDCMPISVDTSNNWPVVDLSYGLKGSSNGLTVVASTGIVVNANGVSVAPDTMAYVEAAARGVGKFHGQDGKAGVGMRYSADGKLEPNLESHDYDSSEAGVLAVKIDSSTNRMVVDLDKGLVASDDGISVKASTGVVVDTNGVSVNASIIANAQAGAKAVGQFAGQDGKPGLGMRITSAGKLEPNLDPFDFSSVSDGQGVSPIRIDTSTNKMVVDINQGLSASTNGLSVKPSTGIVVNANGVSVSPDTMAYVEAAARGVGKFNGQDGKAGAGMRYSSDGKLEPNSVVRSYTGSTDGQDFSPVAIDRVTNTLVVDLSNGLENAPSGVAVKASTGIIVDANGVSVNMAYVVPRGIIVMFSGSAAPSGWAFCNGSNGTPDLRDRFIKGSKSFDTSTGGQTSITYTPSGSVTVNSHTLTVSEMPSHRHGIVSGVHYGDQGAEGRWTTILGLSYTYNYNPGSVDTLALVGGNAGHSHGASFNGNSYTIKLEPQYYALAFIMKL